MKPFSPHRQQLRQSRQIPTPVTGVMTSLARPRLLHRANSPKTASNNVELHGSTVHGSGGARPSQKRANPRLSVGVPVTLTIQQLRPSF